MALVGLDIGCEVVKLELATSGTYAWGGDFDEDKSRPVIFRPVLNTVQTVHNG